MIVAKPFDVAFSRMPKTLDDFMDGDVRYGSLGSLADRSVKEKICALRPEIVGEIR